MLSLLTMVGRLISTENPVVCIHFLFPLSIISLIFLSINSGRGAIWYFDEQGIKRRKVFSSKTKTEAQQKITAYIAQFNEEVHNSDESQKTIKDSLTRWLQVFKFPSVERTTYDRLECTAQHQVYPLIGDKIVGGHYCR